MKFFLSIALVVLTSLGAMAQTQTFSATKYRINNYGQFSESSTVNPTRIVVDQTNGVITMESESSDIQSYMDYNTTFSIVRTDNIGRAKQLVTSQGYAFRFELNARRILIFKAGNSVSTNALYLDELTFE